MSNGEYSKVKSNVPTVHLLKTGHVVLNVRFDGFTANESVEISGYVAQENGAYSAFYRETKVPGDHGQTQEVGASPTEVTANVPVTIERIADLDPEYDLVVVAKVAKVWPTVLTSDPEKAAAAEQKAAAGQNATTGQTADIKQTAGINPDTIEKTWQALPPRKGASW